MVTESQVRDYLDVLFVERGNSPATISAYRRDLAQYLEFLDGREPDTELVSEFISVLAPDDGRRRHRPHRHDRHSET